MSDIMEPVINIRLKSILTKYMQKQESAQGKGERKH